MGRMSVELILMVSTATYVTFTLMGVASIIEFAFS
jgi:hypothetical protein